MNPPATLYSAEQIQERVGVMARTIAAAPLRPDIAMPILVGGFVFAADLLRALAWEGVLLDVEMIWLRSYGDKRVASAISMVAGPSEQIAGRHVLVIDGVLDAGRTIAKAVSLIEAAGGKVEREPFQYGTTGIWIAMLIDPAGNHIELLQFPPAK